MGKAPEKKASGVHGVSSRMNELGGPCFGLPMFNQDPYAAAGRPKKHSGRPR